MSNFDVSPAYMRAVYGTNCSELLSKINGANFCFFKASIQISILRVNFFIAVFLGL